MLAIILGYFSWEIVQIQAGTNVSFRYGLPLYSGMPKQAQEAVTYFNAHPPVNHTSEVVKGILVVNMTVYQYYYSPNLIKVTPGQQIVLIINSPQVITGIYLRLPNGIINVNAVPGIPSYVYFVAPTTQGNYTWYEPEYAGYAFSTNMTGVLEVV